MTLLLTRERRMWLEKDNKRNNTYTAKIVKRTYSGRVDLNEYFKKLLVRKLENE